MKYNFSLILFFLFCSISGTYASSGLEEYFNKTDSFLQKYVINQEVNYEGIKKDPKYLNELVSLMENIQLSANLSKNTLKAFWINAYNIIVIESVIKKYPINSPLNVEGFFNSQKHLVAGKKVTLDQIEKEIILKIDHDPRIHFAINCAAIGCPKLLNKAYRSETLEEQLNESAKSVINNEYYIRVENKNSEVYLNEIFKWYAKDFEIKSKGVIEFLNQFRNKKIPADYSKKYIKYDWKLNSASNSNKDFGSNKPLDRSLQEYTPAVLLLPGQSEIKIFNNLYTQTAYFNDNSDKINQSSRSTYNTILASYLYGLTENINIGFDIWLKSVHNDVEGSSPLKVFNFENNTLSRTAISGIGPKIKFDPFASGFLDGVSIQSTILFPVAKQLEGGVDSPFLDNDAYLWLNQFFYDRRISDNFSFFGEFDTWLRINKDFISDKNSLQIPVKTFLSFYPSDVITFYATVEFSYTFSNGNSISYYNQTGVGAKYQIFEGVEIEGLVTKFFIGKNSGAGNTFNLGLRIVK